MPRKSLQAPSSPENTLCLPTGNCAAASEQQSLSLLSAIVNASDDAIIGKTLFGIITTWNPAAERIFGYTAQEIIGRPKTVLFPPDRLQEEEGILDRLRQGIPTDHFETVRLHKDGTPFYVSMTISPIKDIHGLVIGASTIARDITERKRQEAEFRESEARKTAMLEVALDCVITIDHEGNVLEFNPAAERTFNYRRDEVLGKQLADLIIPPLYRDAHRHGLARYLATGEGPVLNQRVELTGMRADGTEFPIELAISPIHLDGVPLFTAYLRDITERKQLTEQLQTANQWQTDAIEQLKRQQAELWAANARLESLATTDGLTGVKNHRALQERLREEHDRALRYNAPLSLLMLDVDKFKEYNDAFGHPAGDAVLRQVAQILRETARTCDVVARYGGEEFAVLLPGVGVEEAKTVAERLRNAVEMTAWPERAVTVSIGVATLAPATLHPHALLADADIALYRSKHRGRNCVTHRTDPVDVETLDMEPTRWYDGVLQKLLATQTETLREASEQVRETQFEAYDATIVSWSRILDLKDKETEGHSERVTEMMVRLVRHWNLSEQEVLFARWGARLHDIGKMAVPDCILHKPGPLTEDEWVIMRQHTTIAYEMLRPIEFLGPAIDIPYCHHEKWDGTGYPQGLQGEEIPLVARLFAVIDVYDALTSDRPYRRAWPEEKVRVYLQEQAGTHFDPRAVEAVLTMLEEHCTTRQAA